MQQINIDPDIKALIFDCDGTLVDSMPIHMNAWRQAFEHFGARFDEEFIFSMRGMKETEIVERYNKAHGTRLDGNELVDVKHALFLKHLDSVKPIESVVDIARMYHGRLPLAVVSGGVEKVVHAELKAIGIFDLFDIILTADDPYRPKPDPEIFLAAAKKMSTDPGLCIVFEDGDAGLAGAKSAGMRSIDIRDFNLR